MGLNVSHNAFDGAYSAFNRFRQFVAEAWGGSYPPHADSSLDGRMVYFPDGTNELKNPGLIAFMKSNDCEGSFTPKQAKQIADEMESLLPRMKELERPDGGHIGRDGGFVAVTERYIAGCRLAHKKRQKLIYR